MAMTTGVVLRAYAADTDTIASSHRTTRPVRGPGANALTARATPPTTNGIA